MAKYDNVKIIAGNASISLAHDIAKAMGVDLVDAEVEYFANSEIRPLIRESIRRKDVYIIQTGGYSDSVTGHSANDYLMETILLARTLRRSDARSITLIAPFFPYSRQDKKDNPRGAISAKDVADILEESGVNRVITYDLHAAQIQGFFNIPCDDLHTSFLIKAYLDKNVFADNKNFREEYVLVAPDETALKRISQYAGMFGLPLVVLSKERDYSKKNTVAKTVLIGHKKYVDNRTAIIIDDMFDTFGTLDAATATLKEKGIKDVVAVATHGIFSGKALDRINSNDMIKKVVVSDTISQEENQKACKKIDVFSIAPLTAEAIQNLEKGDSLSAIFDKWQRLV